MFDFDNFDKEMEKSKKRFNVFFTVVMTLIVLFWIASSEWQYSG
jgi:hypothetical protein